MSEVDVENYEDTLKNELIKKQILLKKEIMDHCYDQNDFINFCLQKKPDGDDLNSWEYEELVNIVKEFISNINKDNKIIENENENNSKTNTTYEKTEGDTIKINTKEYVKEIECKKIEKNEFNDKLVEVIDIEPNIIETNSFFNLLTSNNKYVLYKIKINILDKEIYRKYSDFIFLREILCENYPNDLIPNLVNKPIEKKFDNDYLNKKALKLKVFLNRVLKIEEYKANKGMYYFLTSNSRDEFIKNTKDLVNDSTTFIINSNFEGKITIKDEIKLENQYDNNDINYVIEVYNNKIISDEDPNERYFFNIKQYFEIQKTLYVELKQNIKNLCININTCTQNINEIQNNLNMLSTLNKKVGMQDNLQNSLKNINVFFDNLNSTYKIQNNLIKNKIYGFLKEMNYESENYIKLINERDCIKQVYIEDYTKLNEKK